MNKLIGSGPINYTDVARALVKHAADAVGIEYWHLPVILWRDLKRQLTAILLKEKPT